MADLRDIVLALMERIWAQIKAHFLLRWMLANMLGWSVGLYVGSTLAASLGSISVISVVAMLPGGAIAGAIAGGMQALALSIPYDADSDDAFPPDLSRRWVIFSTLGGTLGAIPVFFTAFALIGGAGFGFAVMGMGYGLAFGWLQTYALSDNLPDLIWVWLPANGFGGCLCGAFALGINPLGVPVFCTLGPVIFGLVTGLAWRAALRIDLGD